MDKDLSQFSNLSYGPVPSNEQKIPEIKNEEKEDDDCCCKCCYGCCTSLLDSGCCFFCGIFMMLSQK